jgi:hypothetical protein
MGARSVARLGWFSVLFWPSLAIALADVGAFQLETSQKTVGILEQVTVRR